MCIVIHAAQHNDFELHNLTEMVHFDMDELIGVWQQMQYIWIRLFAMQTHLALTIL